MGSPRVVVRVRAGASGAAEATTVRKIDHDEFGNRTVTFDTGAISDRALPIGFAGGLYDADTGFVHFGARDYDPVVGRWTTKDPIRFGGGQANLYAYVDNDPVNYIDPLGEGGIGAGIGAAFGTVGGFILGGAGGLVAALPTGEVAAVGTVPAGAYVGAAAGAGLGAAVGSYVENGITWLAKGGKQRVKDTGLIDLTLEEVQALYDAAKGKDRKRYEKELKGRKVKNKNKRGFFFNSGEDDICEP